MKCYPLCNFFFSIDWNGNDSRQSQIISTGKLFPNNILHFTLTLNCYFYTLGKGTVTASWIPWIRLLFIEDILLYSYHCRAVVIIGLYHISNRNIYIQWENTKKKNFPINEIPLHHFLFPGKWARGSQHQNSLMRTWLNFQYSRKTTPLINHSGDT